MTITKTLENNALTIALEGRLDTQTSPELSAELETSLDGVTSLTLDFKELVYISSAGLRVVLMAQKKMNKQGSMTIKNVCDDIMSVFEITGFADILTIE